MTPSPEERGRGDEGDLVWASRNPLGPLDDVLTLQLAVAWAGETPRLGWWRTDMVSEFGGEDLFRRLLPHTWRWAVFEAAREAARRTDARIRSRDHDPDRLISLFHFGFEADEQLDQRLADLKRSGTSPIEALPGLGRAIGPWHARTFADWLGSLGRAKVMPVPAGRLLEGKVPPAGRDRQARRLAAALVPLADAYPFPHWRVDRQTDRRRHP